MKRIPFAQHIANELRSKEPNPEPTVVWVRNKTTGIAWNVTESQAHALLNPSPAHPSQHHPTDDPRAEFVSNFELIDAPGAESAS